MTEETRGLVLAGVGGQGVVMASMIVADALLGAGHDVKQSEVHGMAQRGGSVVSHIRFGPNVFSPLVPSGSAEVIAAFEWAEALRWMGYVKPKGAVVANVRRIVPPGAYRDRRTWSTTYPATHADVLRRHQLQTRLIDATAVASDLGNARAANSVVLGAMAAFLDTSDEAWEGAIRKHVPPGTVDVNLAAFRAGRNVPPAPMRTQKPAAAKPVAPARIEISQTWCKGCDICSRVCPEYCLSVDDDGLLRAVHPEACTGCRLCELLCPDFAISITGDTAALAGSGER